MRSIYKLNIALIICSLLFLLQDNSSENKEENLAQASYDQATYHVRGEEVSIETPFVITTNIEARSERTGDREILIVFEIPTASQEEMTLAEKMVRIWHFLHGQKFELIVSV